MHLNTTGRTFGSWRNVLPGKYGNKIEGGFKKSNHLTEVTKNGIWFEQKEAERIFKM